MAEITVLAVFLLVPIIGQLDSGAPRVFGYSRWCSGAAEDEALLKNTPKTRGAPLVEADL